VDFDVTLAAEAKRGNDLVLSCELSGKFSGIKVAYLGIQRDLGVILEVFNGLPDGKQKPDATYEALHTAEAGEIRSASLD
jgi:hypothetical protein